MLVTIGPLEHGRILGIGIEYQQMRAHDEFLSVSGLNDERNMDRTGAGVGYVIRTAAGSGS
jgi:hypothetical protein